MASVVSERPARLQWNITRGDDVTLILTFKDAAGVAISLAGRTYAAAVLTPGFAAAQTITVSTSQAASGILTLTMSDTVTALLLESSYLWKLVETNGANTATLLDGPMSVGTPGDSGISSGSSSATVTYATAAGVTVTCTASAGGGGGGGAVSSVNGYTGVVVLAASDVGAQAVGAAAGGDLTGTYPNPTVGAGKITNAQQATMAANTVKANATAGAAVPADLAMAASTILARLAAGNVVAATTAQIKTLLAIANTDVSGLGTLATLSTVTTSEVTDGTLTNADHANMAANTVRANPTAGAAAPSDLAMAASTILARLAAGNVVAATPAQLKTLLAIANTDVSGLGTASTQASTELVQAASGGKETLATNATATGAVTVNLANGNVHKLTLTGNVTLTFSGSTASVACSMTLDVTQDGTGSRTITWPASVKWAGGTAPTISTGASKRDAFAFYTLDNGTTWVGSTIGIDIR